MADIRAAAAALAAVEAAFAGRLGEPLQLCRADELLGRVDPPPSNARRRRRPPPRAAEAAARPPRPGRRRPAPFPRLSPRAEVIACLDRIIEFYDRTEPASPVPYLARRMRRMVPMDFLRLMEDLAPSGIKEFRQLAGLTDDRRGSSRSQGENDMSESKAKVIERNRAPRVQIAYDVEHYGSPTTIELPFVMGVMADLAGASDTPEAAKPVPDRAFVDVDAGRFPKFMEALAPRVKARVKNTLPQAEGAEQRGGAGDRPLASSPWATSPPTRSPSRCRSSPSS